MKKIHEWGSGAKARMKKPMSDGLRGLKEAVLVLGEIIDALPVTKNRNELDEIREKLDNSLTDLYKYVSQSPTISTPSASIERTVKSIGEVVRYLHAISDDTWVNKDENNLNIRRCSERLQYHLQRLSHDANVSVWMILDEQAKESRMQALTPSMGACYNSDKAAELQRRTCTEGTRYKVLTDIHEWVRGKHHGNVYWINGMAGTGKTTIAYSLCQQLDEHHFLSASYFCSRTLPECRYARRIIPSIAYQLAQYSLPFRKALSEAREYDPDAHIRLPNIQFERLIVEPLSNPHVREAMPENMVIVIDALDECEDKGGVEHVLNVLLTKSKGLPFKFVVSSRPEAAIRDQIKKNEGYLSGVVLHEVDSGQVKMDIKRYLQAELTPLRPSEAEIGKLVESAGVLFINAASIVRYIGFDGFQRNPRARLMATLDVSGQRSRAQTRPIDALYETVLRAAMDDDELEPTDQNDMKLVINTVARAETPMTFDKLNRLLKFGDIGRVRAALRPFWSVLRVMESNMTVATLDASFCDYLADPSRCDSEWRCDIPDLASDREIDIAKKCLEDIQDTKPQFNICQLPSAFLYDHDAVEIETHVEKFISAELRYACQNWALHLSASSPDESPTLMERLNQFLTNNLLLWMEVMILTKNLSITAENLCIAKEWAMRHGANQELEDLLQDAWRFAISVIASPVSRSTPHIYLSVLPFLPSHSLIRKHYVHLIPGLPRVDGTVLNRGKTRSARRKARYGWCAACSADGAMLAIGPHTDAQYISLVRTSTGELVRDISLEYGADVRCIGFSPEGTRIAYGTDSNLIWVWDLSSERPPLGPLRGHQGSVISVIFSHNGSRIMSGSYDGTVRIWDASSGECVLGGLAGHTSPVRCLALSLDDKMLVSASNDKIICMSVMHGKSSAFNRIIPHTKNITSIALCPDNSWIVSGSNDSAVRVWDTRTGELLLGPLRHGDQEPTSVAISPDGASILAGFVDGMIQIWDAATGKLKSSRFKEHSGGRNVLVYSTHGTPVVSYSPVDQSLCLFDFQNATVSLDTLPGHTMPILSIDISPDGKRIVSGSEDTTLCIWDPIAGQLIRGSLTGHTSTVHLVRYSPDGTCILSCSSDRTLRQWNAQTGATRETKTPIVDTFVPLEDRWQKAGFVSATYSPDGNSIATISRGGDIQTWDSSNGEMILGPIKTEMEGVSIEFSADGKTLITGLANGTVQIWDMQSRQLLSSHQPQDAVHPLVLAFSPDGLHYITASRNSRDNPTLHQRSTETGAHILGSFTGHTSFVSTARYSSDGKHIVSGSYDKTVHIWDAQTGTSVFGPLRGHTGHVRSVAYSPDGTYVASASDDMTIRVWDARNNNDPRVHGVPNFDEWVLNEDGWVVDDQSRRLIWVPANLRASLMSPRNTVLLSRDGYVQLKFEGARIGEGWDGA